MTIELQSDILRRHRATSESSTPECEWPGCEDDGLCRAPKSPEELNTFRWFCKDHAREYNKSWNYYEGMSDDEVEADVRRDTVWRRPTWRLGSNNFLGAEYGGFDPSKLDDPLGIFEECDPRNTDASPESIPNATAEQRNALAVFSLDGPLTAEGVKQRYKELVKRYHPDTAAQATGPDDAPSDEKIKAVNQAYKVLLDFLCV
jgi:hypothetical protein